MSDRTPGPLKAERTLIRTVGGMLIASAEWADVNPDEARANAAFIALAWNAHDDLLAVCEQLLDEHKLFMRGHDWVCPFCNREALSVLDFPHADECPVWAARNAIVKAKPERKP